MWLFYTESLISYAEIVCDKLLGTEECAYTLIYNIFITQVWIKIGCVIRSLCAVLIWK